MPESRRFDIASAAWNEALAPFAEADKPSCRG